ncbi:hypothetical protein [Serinibacter salmoneus]|uniref:Uncharacterized protein n=1 Tax=Serinibacter salmoneus TaxID=556530 RepID=A0A2A9CWR8_9MICO|nr:hypothetical protein [Serinibacter salmoneus]PFG18586.1 hypothetical protein ATL40_0126 [Serinibacter salmoneus]
MTEASADSSYPTSPIVAAGLIGGYAVARATGVRPLGGAVLAACGILAGREWAKRGIPETVGLSVLYVASFGLSHPLAKKIGAWPAVLTVTAAAAGAAYAMHDHPTPVPFPGSRPD